MTSLFRTLRFSPQSKIWSITSFSNTLFDLNCRIHTRSRPPTEVRAIPAPNCLAGGGGLEGVDVALDFRGDFVLGHLELVMLLHVHPELGAVFEIAAKPQGGIRG